MAKQMAYFEGEFVPIEEASLNVMTHAFNYGTAVFEGIRCLLYTSPSPRDRG